MIDNLLNKNILVVGYGSIGKRHIENLIKLNFKNIFIFRHNSSQNVVVSKKELKVFNDWEQLNAINIYASIICTPTAFHINHLKKLLELNSHILVEKPLSNSKKNINILKDLIIKKKKFVQVAYMLRFHPIILLIKEIIDKRKYGELISFNTKWGEYLPDWHPWEDYKDSYASKKELGGGVSLTLSHDIDLIIWLVNSDIKKTKHFKSYNSKMKINVESGSDIIYEFKNGVIGHSHLDYYSKYHDRYYEFIFDDATLRFNYYESELITYFNKKKKVFKLDKFERNDLFLDELIFFFKKTSEFNINESINFIDEANLIIDICKKENYYAG